MYNKKVCILTTVHPPFDGRIFHRAAKTLADSGYNVTLIATHDRCETVDGIRIIPLAKRTTRLSRMFGTFRVIVLAIKEKADFYHFHDPELLPTGMLLKLLTNAKVIYDVHEDVPEQILDKDWIRNVLMRNLIAVIVNFMEQLGALLFDGIVVATLDIGNKFNTSKTIFTSS